MPNCPHADLSPGVSALIVSINFAPEHSGIGPYVSQIAEHLFDHGLKVEVITGVPHYPSWHVKAPYRRILRRTERVNGITVRRLRHFVPNRQSAIHRGLYEGTFLAQGLSIRPRRVPDVVLAISPSLAAGVIGQRLADRFHVPNALIIQDLMGAAAAQSGIRGGGRVAAVTSHFESSLVRKATRVGVVHESFVPRVLEMGAVWERVVVVRNWTHIRLPRRNRAQVRAELGWRSDQFVILHAGNMGLKQGLDVVIDAAREAVITAPELQFELLGAGNQKAVLVTLAQGLPNLRFRAPVDDDYFPDVLAAADVLLVTQRGSVGDMSMPSKLTSYFAAGRPVLGAVSQGGTASEIERSGAGRVIAAEDPHALWVAARELAQDRALGDELGRKGQRYAQEELSKSAALGRISALLAATLNDTSVKLQH